MGAVVCRVARHFVETRKEIDRITRHLNVDISSKLRAHPAHAFAGRAFSLVRLTLNDEHVCATLFGQVLGHARAYDATANDYDVCGFSHTLSRLNFPA